MKGGEIFEKYPGVEYKLENSEVEKPVVDPDYLRSICAGNELLENLLDEMFDYCYHYTETVLEYEQILTQDITEEEVNRQFQAMEEIRGVVHNATIDSINIFSRALAKAGKDNSWMESVSTSRATYGKFALTITFHELIKELDVYKNRKEVS